MDETSRQAALAAAEAKKRIEVSCDAAEQAAGATVIAGLLGTVSIPVRLLCERGEHATATAATPITAA